LTPTSQPRVWTLVVATLVLVLGTEALATFILQGYVILSSRAVLAGGPLGLDRLDAFYDTLPGILLSATLSATWVGIVALVAATLSPMALRARLGLNPTKIGAWTWALVAVGGLALNQGVDAAFSLVGGGRGEVLDQLMKTLSSARGPALALEVLVVGVLSATCEELFFRGFLQRRLVPRFGPWIGITVPALLFGIAHWDPHHSTFAFLFGLWIGYAAWIANSTWVAVFAHVVNNTVSVLTLAFGADDAGAPRSQHVFVLALAIVAVTAIAAALARRPRPAAVAPWAAGGA
jgi:membrane protease YdiL (CAAX protease family)